MQCMIVNFLLKTMDGIQVALQILDDASLDAEIPHALQTRGQTCWLPQSLNAMLIVHAILYQHLAINTQWDASCAQNEELKEPC